MSIRSRGHELYTIEQSRVGLYGADDKRWVCKDNVYTRLRALGHFDNHIDVITDNL